MISFCSKLCGLLGKSESFPKGFTSLLAKKKKVWKFLKLFNYLRNTQTISNWSVVGFGHFFVAIPILYPVKNPLVGVGNSALSDGKT